MNLLTKLSLVANLGLATFAWWEHKTAYQSAENWLKNQVVKSQAAADASCDQIRSCSSLWKIAFDLASNPKLPISEDDEPEMTPTDESVHSSMSSEEPHSSEGAQSHGEASTVSANEQGSDSHESEALAHSEHDSTHAESSKHQTPLPKWALDLQRRAQGEAVWGSEIELVTDDVENQRAVLKSGSCQLGVSFNSGFFRVDVSQLRQ